MGWQKTFCKESILFHLDSNVYSINVQNMGFIVLRYPHAFASDPKMGVSSLIADFDTPSSFGNESQVDYFTDS